jgi:hypothetical protein
MALNSENTFGLYVALAIYFLLLVLASVMAYRWKQHSSQSKSVESQTDAIEGHFLADRSFGCLVTVGTFFVRCEMALQMLLFETSMLMPFRCRSRHLSFQDTRL